SATAGPPLSGAALLGPAGLPPQPRAVRGARGELPDRVPQVVVLGRHEPVSVRFAYSASQKCQYDRTGGGSGGARMAPTDMSPAVRRGRLPATTDLMSQGGTPASSMSRAHSRLASRQPSHFGRPRSTRPRYLLSRSRDQCSMM